MRDGGGHQEGCGPEGQQAGGGGAGRPAGSGDAGDDEGREQQAEAAAAGDQGLLNAAGLIPLDRDQEEKGAAGRFEDAGAARTPKLMAVGATQCG